jgi:putative transposase
LEFSAIIVFGWTRRLGMKASNYMDVQKALVVKQGEEGTPVAETAARRGSHFNWKKRYVGYMPSRMRRL